MQNFILTGLSGCGKTTLGQRLAEKLGFKFVDTDELVQIQTGRKIADIFAKDGEEAFRQMENRVVLEVASENGQIISTGGGVVLREDNLLALAENGLIIFINKSPALIAATVDVSNRPLLQEGAEQIFKLYNQRIDLYQKYADFEVANDGGPQEALQVLAELAQIAQKSGQEKRFAVIGNPVGHSLSPRIHLPVLRRFYKNARYELAEVTKEGLAPWVEKEGRFLDGFNITMPHKVGIIPFLDGLTEDGRLLATINTVVRHEQGLLGHNTDGIGFQQALAGEGKTFKGSRVTFLGAGGVSTSLALKAAMEGAAKINILARRPEKAQEITGKVEALEKNTALAWGAWDIQTIKSFCGETDILINATPLGMEGIDQNYQDFSFLDSLDEKAILCDLIYKPNPTALLLEGQKRGLKTLSGLPMLIYQALYADRLYIHPAMTLQGPYERVLKALRTDDCIKERSQL